jgi:hypothetical protein
VNPLTTLSPDDLVIVGIDPGPRPGLCALRFNTAKIRCATPVILQCYPASAAITMLKSILPRDVKLIILSYELWIPSNKAGKLATPSAAIATGKMCARLDALPTEDDRIVVKHHSAAQVKPWATIERMEKAGLELITKGMTHARDGGKQALFCAVHSAGVPDPLSRKHRKIDIPA